MREVHQLAKKAVEEAMRPYVDELGAEVMLAIMAQMVGMLIALQDQTKHTTATVMDLVMQNIQIGNQLVLESVFGNMGETEQ